MPVRITDGLSLRRRPTRAPESHVPSGREMFPGTVRQASDTDVADEVPELITDPERQVQQAPQREGNIWNTTLSLMVAGVTRTTIRTSAEGSYPPKLNRMVTARAYNSCCGWVTGPHAALPMPCWTASSCR